MAGTLGGEAAGVRATDVLVADNGVVKMVFVGVGRKKETVDVALA